ncbi:hypothetical protein A2313_01230 [Candidatus Roizmanbacteria bacterium RIFOXYB2_FULL_41_10]|uniref:Glycosyl transferase family 1 domain-containing protein n=1 Tax=Candidatus Roizmanbacteria bacterium RIFOXYA1_FULL_41_12 TaxID=1802082 RepID=A0A1F7KF27_9BACT|nr:MAG: hypothetical protein A2209_01735 [Candidatus Roizmanbacteria bacterium RIFOXYA1_FULL_41_12]OGK67803.1 MAG: hypothetical protein A2377_04140 [Candidatus Roizmanbacteria bacterium RIFOXYB1_FULL_41_27]OGK69429.1 MAG: hypothetical protein A2313_01230 [Candidatus Roizmanbacteria bacterium RIFOXYB2_FULL_41_10]OGK71958.1 MAG: hypothetical protein A2403_03315 [Candidatus Roizmanbacteria bacterium RIFOXYC1_FULL_41_16]OGK75365.1 MAG: hypothetical protein A2575_02010 [Candidatus Roizmanbacteria ba
MRIGIDISQIVYSGTGVARYTQGLVEAILQYENQHQWVFFFASLRRALPAKLVAQIAQKGFILKQYKIPPTLLSLLWNRWHFINVEWLTGKLDWYISSDWTEPPVKNAKKATIIHDLAFLHYPETIDWKILKTQQQRLIHVCHESDLILADSDSTKRDIEHFLTLNKAKVQTIYPGISTRIPDKSTVQKTLAKFGLKKQNFILSVGKLEPRKNLERLLEAYKKLNQSKYQLIIVGPKGWGSLNLAGENVRVIGFVKDEELYSLYQACLFFVYPSLYEGFGYPVLEAASLGAAIATSNRSSLQELGQGISLQFNPENVADITGKMSTLISNPDLRTDLSQKAIVKSQEFTWQKTYQQIVEVLKNS